MTRKVRAISVLVAVALTGGMASAARATDPASPAVKDARPVTAQRAPKPAPATSEVAVRFRRGATSSARTNAARKANAEVGAAIPGTEFVRMRPKDTARRTAASLETDPDVSEVVPIFERRASALPNDTYWGEQSESLLGQHLPEAWAVSTGTGQIIAVVDTGVDATHPDLVGRVLPGRDIVNNDGNASDDNGHGTAVAGVAAAKSNNSMGIAGIASNARILPVKVLDADGMGIDPDIAEGIVWATDQGAKVINISLGGYGQSPVLEQAVAYALARDVVIVAATGNEATQAPSYPASSPGVIGVGATDGAGQLVLFSNWGAQVDVVAPGWDLIVPDASTDGYMYASGTSFSAPIVSGVAALVRSAQPGLSQAAVAARIKDTATDGGPDGDDDKFGGGIVNAWAAQGGPALDGALPVVDSHEPDDTPDAASLLTAPVVSTIAPEGDVDWFAFDAATPGVATVTVALSSPLPSNHPQPFDAVVRAYSSVYEQIGEADVNWGPHTGELLVVPIANAGRFYFRINNWFPSIWAGTYTVSMSFTPEIVAGQPAGSASVALRSTNPGRNAVVAPTTLPSLRFTSGVAAGSVPGAVSVVRADDGTAVPATVALTAPDTITVDPTAAALKSGPYLVRVNGLRTATDVLIDPIELRFTVRTIGPYVPFTSANGLLAQQTVDVLGRTAEPAVVSWLASFFEGGVPQPVAMADLFFRTSEYSKVIAPLARLYMSYFNRAPDHGGLQGWVTYMRNGWSLASVAEAFARSSEFLARYGALTNASFVDLVYRNVLGRAPDPNGLDYWLGGLTSGRLNRGSVMLGFSESAEFRATSASRVDVSVVYGGMLRRAPSSAEQLGWIGGIAAGRTRQSLVGDVFNTREYRSRFGA